MLYNYKMLQISIINMKQEIDFIDEETGVGGMDYESLPSNTNKINSITENIALSNMEKKEYLEMQIERNSRQLEKLDRTIKELSETQREVIIEKYIKGKQWYEVSGIVYKSERHCRQIRTDAINKLVIGIYGENR